MDKSELSEEVFRTLTNKEGLLFYKEQSLLGTNGVPTPDFVSFETCCANIVNLYAGGEDESPKHAVFTLYSCVKNFENIYIGNEQLSHLKTSPQKGFPIGTRDQLTSQYGSDIEIQDLRIVPEMAFPSELESGLLEAAKEMNWRYTTIIEFPYSSGSGNDTHITFMEFKYD